MEFLLANHPLDCPICDQGGECDLQDISEVYGYRKSRFKEYKRSVEDKDFGPLIKTVMTRCIHCTRCVRFTEEVSGEGSLGTAGRGRDTEITTYIEKLITHEMSANIIDLCPVGALTSHPYAFKARPWELRQQYSVDTLDPLVPNTQVDYRGAEIMRVIPRINDDVNEEWISDKTRFGFDGVKRQRLSAPMKKNARGEFIDITWEEALELAASELLKAGENVTVSIGDQADCEAIVTVKDLVARLGADTFSLGTQNLKLDPSLRNGYLLNSRIRGVEDADLILLVGTNTRTEAPLLNARIRKEAVKNGKKVGLIGAPLDLCFPYQHLGNGPNTLLDILEGKNPFCARIAEAKRPLILMGSHVFEREDGDDLHKLCLQLAERGFINKADKWNGFAVLHSEIGAINALEIGLDLSKQSKTKPKLVYLLHQDRFADEDIPADAFVIYQGTHGDKGATRANLILPGATYMEKSATYVNTEGRPALTHLVSQPPFLAKEDWEIPRALSEIMEIPLPYESVYQVRERLAELAPHLVKYNYAESSGLVDASLKLAKEGDLSIEGKEFDEVWDVNC